MKRTDLRIGVATLGLAMLVTTSHAQAAPQILGLVASAAPTKLQCENGVCHAEFSSFCLQQHRHAPNVFTAYRPAQQEQLTLVVTGPGGEETRRPAGGVAKIESLRTYATVRISLAEADLKKLGGVSAAIEVSPLASLVPVPQPTDKSPLSATEIAQYTGPLRVRAEATIDPSSQRMLLARVTRMTVNGLPQSRPATQAEEDTAWQASVATLPASPTGQAVRKLMDREFRDCRFISRLSYPDGKAYDTVRSCMAGLHDEFIQPLTRDVWKAVGSGS